MVNRQHKRLQAKEERRAGRGQPQRVAEREEPVRERTRTSPPEFLREVRQELKKVAWPTRDEVVSYTVVVLAATAVLTAIVFGMDFVFGRLVFTVFGGS
jgi:preprotein translocase subunit SecE